jgi:hypothetical protein
MKKYFTLKNALILLTFITIVGIAFVVYRLFFQFSDKDVNTYLDEEAAKYGDGKDKARKIICDGVDHILSSQSLTKQVLRSAEASGTPKEMELVHAAASQCRAYGYID